MNAFIGTPTQEFYLNLDTGSSDMWVNAPGEFCDGGGGREHSYPCQDSGIYRANASRSYNYINSDFEIKYVDGTGASGDYATDDFEFNFLTIKDFQFGIGYESTSGQGVLGIGYPEDENRDENDGKQTYENLPQRLVSDGVVSSKAFSLYLGDLTAVRGSILFGGIDSAKFDGELVTLPIQQLNGKYSKFLITLTGFDFASSVARDDLAMSALLDSGTTMTYLPEDIVKEVIDELGLSLNKDSGTIKLPCTMKDDDRNMTFKFSAPASITVPMSELVVNLDGSDRFRGKDGKPVEGAECVFGIAPSSGGSVVLGDTFLRSAYVVFDMDNHEISIAQSKPGVKVSHLIEIEPGHDGVPSTLVAEAPVAAKSGYPGSGVGLTAIRTDTVLLGGVSLLIGLITCFV